MPTTVNELDSKPLSRSIKMLKQLWCLFLRQNLKRKGITLIIIVFCMIFTLFFFSGLIIWKIFCVIMIKGFLALLETYLNAVDPGYGNHEDLQSKDNSLT